MAICRFFKMMAAAAIWDFLILFFTFSGRNGQECRTASLCKILSKFARIFGFFKMAAADILDFKNFKFSTPGHVKKVELLYSGKSRRNRSNPGRHIVIF